MRNLIIISLIFIAGGCTSPATPRRTAHEFLQGVKTRDFAMIENSTCNVLQAQTILANTPPLTAGNYFDIRFYSETLNGDQATEKFYTITTRGADPDTTLWTLSMLRVRDNHWRVFTPSIQKTKL